MAKLTRINGHSVLPVDWSKPIEWDDETPCWVCEEYAEFPGHIGIAGLPPHVHPSLQGATGCNVRKDYPCPGNAEVNPHLATCFVRNRPRLNAHEEFEWTDGAMADWIGTSIHADGTITYKVTRRDETLEVNEYGDIVSNHYVRDLFLRNKHPSVRAAMRVMAKREIAKQADEEWQAEQKSLQNNPLFGSF